MKKGLVLSVVVCLVVGLAVPVLAADENSLRVTARVVGSCHFTTATSELAFGDLDTSATADAAASTSVECWCTRGTLYSITDDDGMHESGPESNRMEHVGVGAEYIPYTLDYDPTAGTGAGRTSEITVSIDGTIANADYVDALVGDYEDTVVLSINP